MSDLTYAAILHSVALGQLNSGRREIPSSPAPALNRTPADLDAHHARRAAEISCAR